MKSRDPRLDPLANRVREVIDGFPSLAEAARATGLPVNSLSRMRRGANEPGAFDLIDFAAKTGVDLRWLAGLPGEATRNDRTLKAAPPRDTVTIRELDVKVAAGASSFADQIQTVESFEFPGAFLRQLKIYSQHLECVRVKGDSMTPTILPGALLMIDRSLSLLKYPPIRSEEARRTKQADIFVFIHSKMGYRVKRIETLDEKWAALISDNQAEYPVEIVDRNKSLKIVGKVVWWDNLNLA